MSINKILVLSVEGATGLMEEIYSTIFSFSSVGNRLGISLLRMLQTFSTSFPSRFGYLKTGRQSVDNFHSLNFLHSVLRVHLTQPCMRCRNPVISFQSPPTRRVMSKSTRDHAHTIFLINSMAATNKQNQIGPISECKLAEQSQATPPNQLFCFRNHS